MTQVQDMGVQLHRLEMTEHRVSEQSHAIRHYEHPVPVQGLTNYNKLNLEYPSSAYLAERKERNKSSAWNFKYEERFSLRQMQHCIFKTKAISKLAPLLAKTRKRQSTWDLL